MQRQVAHVLFAAQCRDHVVASKSVPIRSASLEKAVARLRYPQRPA